MHGWLDLLQISGPFLTSPVVTRVFPNGLPPVPTSQRADLRALVAQMLDDRGASRHAVVRTVLRIVLDWGEHLRLDADVPDSLSEVLVEHAVTLRPDLAFFATERDDDDAAEPALDVGLVGDEPEESEPAPVSGGGPWRLLGAYAPWGAHPLARITAGGWTASPVERLAVLLRARDVPVGLVTDGRWWSLVWAPRGGATGAAVWDASLWSEEPESLQALVALLHRARFLAMAEADTLPRLLLESLERQEEVTETLGRQVREAVEMLVGTLDQLDHDSGRVLLAGVDDDELYSGVVTLMMRVVFLFFAEERRLLPSDDDLYVSAYSVTRLVDQLESRAQLAGEQTLEHRTSAWHRLLAVTRAVHAGVAHEDLRLPAYDGGLFDPDRYPWLEGRVTAPPDTGARQPAVADRTVTRPSGAARPPTVDDRTVLAMLRAVQYVQVGGQRRRLTFRALDVEQIGYVYEGLLELEVRTASEVVLGFVRPPKWPRVKETSEVGLSDAVERVAAGPQSPALADWLAARTGWTVKRLETVLASPLEAERRSALLRAVSDPALVERIAPFAGALRYDARGRPAVALPGARYVAPSTRRAATGTHYTPRWLAEDVAGNALEPLVYRPGALETADRSQWVLRPSSALLSLRVADIAMGSGAFLVAACRYLADRLVEAWEAEGREDALRAVAARAGQSLASDADVEEVLLEARRLVADHCLYGVDVNRLAVEMAKLSLWLVTMDRERPFGFLDDRFLCGDSLLGLWSIDQLEALHVDPVAGRRLRAGALDYTSGWRGLLERAADLRRRITSAPVVTIRDVEHKARLLAEVEALSGRLAVVADAITGTGVVAAGLRPNDTHNRFVTLSLRLAGSLDGLGSELRAQADSDLQAGRPEGIEPRRPFHWPLEFPEVFVDAPETGFDAIIGNPPFLGGTYISGRLGTDYGKWLQRWDGCGVRGNADLAARFVLRAALLLDRRGQLGYVATNTLVQGDTLDVGLTQVTSRGFTLTRGRSSHKWPSTSANLEIVDVWASRAPIGLAGLRLLDGEEVPNIGADLQPVGRVGGRPQRLEENEGMTYTGSKVYGLGFVVSLEEAAELIDRDPRNAEVLKTYVTGKDLNSRPDSSASRWVIDFWDWPVSRCEQYPEPLDIVRRLVKPERDRVKRENPRRHWWRFEHHRAELYAAIARFESILAIARVSSSLAPTVISTGAVYSDKCVLFATNDLAQLAIISSSLHQAWVVRYATTLGTSINYSPSDLFDTFPRPRPTPRLEHLGGRLHEGRRALMLGRGWGLTTTYNHVHDPSDRDPEVRNLRDIHTEIDYAVLKAYGWDDLDPQICHHPTKIGVRWTVSKDARFELLDRLLEENHRRHALEQGRPG